MVRSVIEGRRGRKMKEEEGRKKKKEKGKLCPLSEVKRFRGRGDAPVYNDVDDGIKWMLETCPELMNDAAHLGKPMRGGW